jgi:AraC family L-rhamnose operon regulatory protein RhaS
MRVSGYGSLRKGDLMHLTTTGKTYHQSYEMPLYYCLNSGLPANINNPRRYKILFIEAGAGILSINHHHQAIIAPTVGCFSETAHVDVEKVSHLETKVLYFHPNVINRMLTFGTIRSQAFEPYSSENMDYNTLQPFFHHNYGGWIRHLDPISTQRLQELLKSISNQLEVQPNLFWPCRSRSFLIELLFLILQLYNGEIQAQASPPEPEEPSQNLPGDLLVPPESREIYPILVYLFNNYRQKITIENLTRHFQTNRNTLSQKFKQATGTSVIEYVSQLRVRVACQLLKDTTLPVSEICERVGYDDLTHFGRRFRKYVRLSPSEYRKHYQLDIVLTPHSEN